MRPHYDIAGWYLKTETGLSDMAWLFTAPINKPITLVAKWKYVEAKHSVNFVLDSAEQVQMQKIGYEEKATLPELPREVIWYTDQDYTSEFNFDTPIVEDITLYGLWQDFRGTWSEFVTFLASKDDSWFADETTGRGFIIEDDTAENTEGLATEVITAKLTRFNWEKHNVKEESYGDPVEQLLSVLSKAKWVGAVLDLRKMTALKEISDSTFRGFNALKKVYFPEGSIQKIGFEAFRDCGQLVEMSLPSTVRDIGENAFKACVKIQNDLVIPDGVTEINKWAFRDCQSIRKLTLPSSVKVVHEGAFMALKITRLELPEGLETLEAGAFAYCGRQNYFYLPSTIKSVSAWFFWKSSSYDYSTKYNGTKYHWENSIAPLGYTYLPAQCGAYDIDNHYFQLAIYYMSY